jgi:hypothetical protein
MPDKILNSKTITGPLTYVVRDNDDVLNVNTTLGIVTLVFANIRGSGFNLVQKQYYVNDIGNQASVNNIFLEATNGDRINNVVIFPLITNGVSIQLQISSQTEWLATGDVASIGFSGVEIPKPHFQFRQKSSNISPIYTWQTNIYFSWKPTQDNGAFLNQNPLLFLFRKNRKSRKKVKIFPTPIPPLPPTKFVKTGSGYYHPVHEQGSNWPDGVNFYKGSSLWDLTTEFQIPLNPGKWEFLPFNGFNWIGFAQNEAPPRQLDVTDFMSTTSANSAKFMRGSKPNSLSMTFVFAIGIKNPNTANGLPYIFGEFSEPIKLRIRPQQNGGLGYKQINQLEILYEASTIKKRN